ncbi:MAG TPA: putative colanic acid biosynthesis acetyltransferase [Propionibacterium sp.]|nr:putative colanic acid biosynthesis acetyltransferase [Propionibacterium sp.]
MWHLVGQPLVSSRVLPSRLRVSILRKFGASIGAGTLIREGVRVHWPWKLSVGSNCWIGVDAWILNLESVVIGDNVCVSQQALLCTGSHQRRSPTFEFDNAPISIGSRAWIATRATVLRGVTIGENALIAAGAVASADVAPGAVVRAAGSSVHD